jgi:hypothetical protein
MYLPYQNLNTPKTPCKYAYPYKLIQLLSRTYYHPLQLRLRPTIQQIRHLKARPIRVQARRRPLTIPRPLLLQLWF